MQSALQAACKHLFHSGVQSRGLFLVLLSSVAMADVRFARLTKAWKHLKLSKSRQSKGLDWLRWDEDEDKEAEPSSHTLTLNCPMVYCMFECLQQLTLISIDRLSKSATQLALEVASA